MKTELLNIFFVDDSPADHELFQRILRQTSFPARLTAFENSADLLARLQNIELELPDFIFLDLHMKEKCGKICLQEIRSNEMLAPVPIIIRSATAYEADIDETFEYGANLFVPKERFYSKKTLNHILTLCRKEDFLKRDKDKYVLYSD